MRPTNQWIRGIKAQRISIMEEHLIDWPTPKAGYGRHFGRVYLWWHAIKFSGCRCCCVIGQVAQTIGNRSIAPDSEWSVQRDGIQPEAIQKLSNLFRKRTLLCLQKNMAMIGMGFNQSLLCHQIPIHKWM